MVFTHLWKIYLEISELAVNMKNNDQVSQASSRNNQHLESPAKGFIMPKPVMPFNSLITWLRATYAASTASSLSGRCSPLVLWPSRGMYCDMIAATSESMYRCTRF